MRNIKRKTWMTGATLACALLTSIAVSALGPRPNGKIAFSSDRAGNSEIYLMNPDGTDQVRLTNNNIFDGHPAWSPDGKRIAFVSHRPTGQFGVFHMNADGTGKTEITTINYQPSPYYGTGWRISWSPDGSQLAFSDLSGNSGAVVVVNLNGSGRRTLTSGYGPSWSPDGSKILFIRGAFPWTLHTIRPDGSALGNLPSLPDFYNWYYDATWSRTGSEIAVTAFDGANEVIFITNADGTNPQYFYGECVEAPLGCSRLAEVSWSPDGRTLLFHSWGLQSGLEIYVRDLAGGEARRLTNTNGSNRDPSWQPLAKAVSDFDADGRSDVSLFRPDNGVWYLNRSTAGVIALQWGTSTDKIAPADYDGDAKADVAVYRPSEGRWYIFNSATSTFSTALWGVSTDMPTPGDFDNDGRADIAIFRQSDGNWWISRSSAGTLVQNFGQAGDHPAVGDYDGDGRSDIATFRPSTGVWYLLRSAAGVIGYEFGLGSDKVTPADYDGDGKTDIAVYRPSEGKWYIVNSSNAATPVHQFGTATDIPAPGDYDGDGNADLAIFRPIDGTWWIDRTSAGLIVQQFGQSGDKPTPNAFGN